ncbi:hypothetical protein ENBRE01_2409 [Enteropsectra breve]|nr:hypothetical protein ENBRE01_2409 [Enteropsectra breve]
MKILPTLGIICITLAKLVLNSHQRPYRDQFKTILKDSTTTRTFDFRDLFLSKQFSMAYFAGGASEISSELALLIKRNELYQNTLAEIEINYCSTDTYEYYEKLIESEIKKHDYLTLFNDVSAAEESEELRLSFSLDVIYDVFQLTSSWCDNLNVLFNEVRAIEILKAFDYLDIFCEKEIDLFFDDRGKPLHLRIRAINLFCINFVYLLKKYNLLVKWQTLLASSDKASLKLMIAAAGSHPPYKRMCAEEQVDTLSLIICIGKIPPLRAYIFLLQVKTQEESICNLFLGSAPVYFAYKWLYETDSKAIFLQNDSALSKDLAMCYPKLDLLTEFNTLNKSSVTRLNISMPFCNASGEALTAFKDKNPLECIYTHNNYYINFIQIHREITEVYIDNFLPLFSIVNYSVERDNWVDIFLEEMVLMLFKELEGLKALFIRGFIIFPETLVKSIRNKKLEKFGALSWNGEIDFYVIYQIFGTECALLQSFKHFIGHYRALEFLFRLTEKLRVNIKIMEATVSDIMACHEILPLNIIKNDASLVYYERIYENMVIEYFEENDTQKELIHEGPPIIIDSFYYMEPPRILKIDAETSRRTGWPRPPQRSYEIRAVEIFEYCVTSRLVILDLDKGKKFFDEVKVILRYGAYRFDSVELILSNEYRYQVAKKMREFKNTDNGSLFINLKGSEQEDICSLYDEIALKPMNNTIVKIRLRVSTLANLDLDELKSYFDKQSKETNKNAIVHRRNFLELEAVPFNFVPIDIAPSTMQDTKVDGQSQIQMQYF